MKAVCCESDATHIGETGIRLCAIGVKAFQLGQIAARFKKPIGLKDDRRRRCVACLNGPVVDEQFQCVDGLPLCEICFPMASYGYASPDEQVYPLDTVRAAQAWPDGPWFVQGTVAGGLANMVKRFTVSFTAESVLDAVLEFVRLRSDNTYSTPLVESLIYNDLWLHLQNDAKLTSRAERPRL